KGIKSAGARPPVPKKTNQISRLQSQIAWLLAVGEQSLVEVRLNQVSEQQFRAQAVLLVSMLSRNKDATPPQLQKYSVFPVNLPTVDQLGLAVDAQQLSRLKRGSVVVSYDSEQNNNFTVYAPVPNSDKAVALGPVPQFDDLPLSIVLGMLAITGLVVIAVSYWLVSRLETRLTQISDMVSTFGRGNLQARVKTGGQDAIANLGTKINGMATRIETLLQSQRDITQAVSHELRTPLARIRFRLGLLDDALQDNNAITDKTNAIRNDLTELEQLIDETLEHHKLTQLPDLPAERINISDLIKRVVKQTQELYPDTTIQLHVRTNKNINAHLASIERLLANLLNNACKYGAGSVHVSYQQQDKTTVLHVDDNGQGIPPTERQKIFTPFYQLDESRNKKKPGYGLGLAIVARITSLLGAQIEITDSTLGGARFSVFFPQSATIEARDT
ncbi:MAG: ATP-binding protein, partial [Thiolinea sp.]